jgi:hypothetical protein
MQPLPALDAAAACRLALQCTTATATSTGYYHVVLLYCHVYRFCRSYLPLAHIYERFNFTLVTHYGAAAGFYRQAAGEAAAEAAAGAAAQLPPAGPAASNQTPAHLPCPSLHACM